MDRDTIPKPFQMAEIRERLTVEVKEALKVSLGACIRCLSQSCLMSYCQKKDLLTATTLRVGRKKYFRMFPHILTDRPVLVGIVRSVCRR